MAAFLNSCLSDLGCPKDQLLAPYWWATLNIHHSNIKLFADDIALYKEIKSPSDRELLQDDLTKIYQWCLKWLLKLNLLKCESICISYKHLPPLCVYCLRHQQIPLKSVVKYLGVFINSQLKWGDHVNHLALKASRSLNYLHHTLFSCSTSVKATTYKAIVREQFLSMLP